MFTGYSRKVVLKSKRFISSASNRFGIISLFTRTVLVLLIISLGLNLVLYSLQGNMEFLCEKAPQKRSTRSECVRTVKEVLEKDRVIYRAKDGTNVTTKDALLVGNDWKRKVFLTIGLPTIERDNGVDYLTTTLDSLLQNVSNAENQSIKIVILLTDAKQETINRRLKEIKSKYSSYIENGKIQVIAVPPNGYPQLRGLPRTLGDTSERMYWRSKQAIDFAFLMEYSRVFSPYYLQMEDDVIATQDYDIHIREYIKEKEDIYWFNLDFSNMGFIGKLFRSNTLRDLVRFLRLLYSEVPIDLLLGMYREVLGNELAKTTYPRNIFIHIGRTSSALSR